MRKVGEFVELGAIAVLDALGFKGIWSRLEADVVFGKLRRLRDTVLEDVFQANAKYQTMMASETITRHAKFFSDTAVVGTSVRPGGGMFPAFPTQNEGALFGQVREDHSVRDILATLVRFLGVAAAKPAPFAYRGCISSGEFAIEDDFLLGPAIDDAAVLANEPDGAFVMLTPEAARALTSLHMGGPYIELYNIIAPAFPVPMKHGPPLESRVLNPLATIDLSKRDELLVAYLETFASSRPEVLRKRDNTAAFLQYCYQLPTTKDVMRRLLPPLPPSLRRKRI